MRVTVAVILFLSSMRVSLGAEPCPSACLCIVNDHYAETIDITCENRTSQHLQLPPSVSSLYFVNVSTQFIQSTNLVPMYSSGSDLIKVVYKHSGIRGLSQSAFSDVPYLEHLDLSGNLIAEIPETVFHPLTSLRLLNLNDNKIPSLADSVFKYQQYLNELNLSKNNLVSTHYQTYSNCSLLRILDLSYNDITSLENSLNPSLVVLLMNNNRLKEMSSNTFANLESLRILNLANNNIKLIKADLFRMLKSLEGLDLKNNEIEILPKGTFEKLTNLQVLNISKNPISHLEDNLFQTNLDLNSLAFANTQITKISASLLSKLKRLRVLTASHNYRLSTIEDFKFTSSNHLQYIDLSFNNLTSLPIFISHLQTVEYLNLENNPWKCNCRSGWFVQWLANNPHAINSPLSCDEENMTDKLVTLNCEAPQARNDTLHQVLEFRSTVVLTCYFNGEPAPSITWVTPSGYIFHYYPRNNSTDIFSSHPRIHLYNLDSVAETRITVLSNGSLEIQELLRQDAGIYTCLAINPVGNATSHIVVTLDRKTFFHIKIMCIMVGASCVIGMLLCTAIGQLIKWILKRLVYIHLIGS